MSADTKVTEEKQAFWQRPISRRTFNKTMGAILGGELLSAATGINPNEIKTALALDPFKRSKADYPEGFTQEDVDQKVAFGTSFPGRLLAGTPLLPNQFPDRRKAIPEQKPPTIIETPQTQRELELLLKRLKLEFDKQPDIERTAQGVFLVRESSLSSIVQAYGSLQKFSEAIRTYMDWALNSRLETPEIFFQPIGVIGIKEDVAPPTSANTNYAEEGYPGDGIVVVSDKGNLKIDPSLGLPRNLVGAVGHNILRLPRTDGITDPVNGYSVNDINDRWAKGTIFGSNTQASRPINSPIIPIPNVLETQEILQRINKGKLHDVKTHASEGGAYLRPETPDIVTFSFPTYVLNNVSPSRFELAIISDGSETDGKKEFVTRYTGALAINEKFGPASVTIPNFADIIDQLRETKPNEWQGMIPSGRSVIRMRATRPLDKEVFEREIDLRYLLAAKDMGYDAHVELFMQMAAQGQRDSNDTVVIRDGRNPQ